MDDKIVRQASVTIQPAGFTMTGDIDMGGNKITNLGDPLVHLRQLLTMTM